MWNFQGKPLNFKSAILGKITRKKRFVIPSRNSFLVTTNKNYINPFIYAGILTDQKVIKKNKLFSKPCIYGIPSADLASLNDDDIVLVEPNGQVNRLWDIGVNDNAIFATGRCNCKCIMCPQPPKNDPPELQELNLRLIRLLNPQKTKALCITGGEPTLLGNDFMSLINECSKRLTITPVAVLTNGKSFSDFNFTKNVCKCRHNDITFCIALYSDNDKDHDDIVRSPGSFYNTIKGITNLALFDQKIEIRFVITAKNFQRIPQFADFIYRNFPFVIHVAFMGMEITGYALENYEEVWVDPSEYIQKLKDAVIYLNRRQINVSIYNLQLCLLPLELWKYSRKSISVWKNKYIEVCQECSYMKDCSGFFSTSGTVYSKNIKPIKKVDI